MCLEILCVEYQSIKKIRLNTLCLVLLRIGIKARKKKESINESTKTHTWQQIIPFHSNKKSSLLPMQKLKFQQQFNVKSKNKQIGSK
jgi:hypothetical protein